MFDFMDEDWFIITLEVVFLILVVYDVKKYMQTRKKEYITNIVLTIGFAIWTLYPMYICYFKWDEEKKQEFISSCKKDKNETLCRCIDEAIFKSYTYDEFKSFESKKLEDIKTEFKEDCVDDSWF